MVFLELHRWDESQTYILGIFLTGAYQEILGDLHNLFGDTNAIHVRLKNGGYEITDLVHGDTVTEVLNYVQFHASDLLATFRRKVSAAKDLSLFFRMGYRIANATAFPQWRAGNEFRAIRAPSTTTGSTSRTAA